MSAQTLQALLTSALELRRPEKKGISVSTYKNGTRAYLLSGIDLELVVEMEGGTLFVSCICTPPDEIEYVNLATMPPEADTMQFKEGKILYSWARSGENSATTLCQASAPAEGLTAQGLNDMIDGLLGLVEEMGVD